MGETVKLTNQKASAAFLAYQRLLHPQNVLPPMVALHCDRNMRVLQDIVETYEKQRVALVKKYGAHDEETDSYSVGSDALEEFTAEHDPIANEEHEVNVALLSMLEVARGYAVDPTDGRARILSTGNALGVLDAFGLLKDVDPLPAAPTPIAGRRRRRP